MTVESLARGRRSATSAFQDGGDALKLCRMQWYAWPMPTQERSKTGQSPSLDAVFVDLVRLAAKNDAPAITRRVRRWVGSPAARRSGLTDTLRGEILAALESTPEHAQRTRRTLQEDHARAPLAPLPQTSPPTEPVLPSAVQRALERIVAEYRGQDTLARHGLTPIRTLLLSGPPGVGKTMTAAWVADQLGLPLYSIEPSQIMTSLLGDSARNLIGAFEEAHKTPCVVLLDEIDAFGKSRDDPHDVGELKRLVTTLLVELDRWPAGKLIVGATNHPGLLDHALERRFEQHLTLGPPGADERARIITAFLRAHELEISRGTLQALLELTEGATGSDLVAAVRAAVRTTVLEDEPLELALLREALPTDSSGIPRHVKAAIARAAAEHAGLPHRTIAELLSCSHTTVGRLLNDDSHPEIT